MTDLIRSSSLTGYRALVENLGGDAAALLRRFHLSADTLAEGDALISYRSVVQLMEATAAKLKCDDFGLRLANQQGLHTLGPLAIIALSSSTLGEALNSIIQHLDYYSPVCVARLDTTKNRYPHPVLTFEAAIMGEIHRRQRMEFAIGVSFRDLQFLTENKFRPRGVMFRHSALSPRRVYLKHFGVAVQFDQPFNGIAMSNQDLACPLKANNPYLRQIVVDYATLATRAHPLDVARQVQFLLNRLLPGSRISLRIIAGHLGMHERTLQRRLEVLGLSFETLLDSARRERAEVLLTDSRLSMAQIAVQLGYNEQSSFNRACRRWFGVPPLSIRGRYARVVPFHATPEA